MGPAATLLGRNMHKNGLLALHDPNKGDPCAIGLESEGRLMTSVAREDELRQR